MRHALSKNLVGGGLLLLFGASFAGYALAYLKLGGFARMGPGLFPALIGVILAGIGAFMLATEIIQARVGGPTRPVSQWQRIEWRALFSVIAAMAAFSLVIVSFGVIPGIFAIVAVAALAGERLRPLTVVALSTGLSVAAYLIFVLALGLPFSLFKWPF